MVASAASRPIPMPLSPSGVPRPFQAWGTDNPHPFTGRPMYYFKVTDGQQVEHGLRLQDHRARWLDLLHGRWLQRDPAGYVDGMNLYEYVQGRPTVLGDGRGLFACERVVENAPTSNARAMAFGWLTDWKLYFAWTTSAGPGDNAGPYAVSQADTFSAYWARQYAELFKCCRSGCPVYLWGGPMIARTRVDSRIQAPSDAYEVEHLTGGIPVGGGGLTVPGVSALYVTANHPEWQSDFLNVAQKPINRPEKQGAGIAIEWAWPIVGPPGMKTLVSHVGCDPTGRKAPWPGTNPANTLPPSAPWAAGLPILF